MTPVTVIQGEGPVILGQPHCGVFVPPEIESRFNPCGRTLSDTDWHVDRLYDGLSPNATVVRANFHRYVIDANRDPSGKSLYPGQNTTGLVPLVDFENQVIWSEPPTAQEIDARRMDYHVPYHLALAAEIDRVRDRHGIALLYDCHSIRSRLPFLFDGELPVFNIGTNGGLTCAKRIERAAHELASSSPFETVLNGRFRGGWTTRHYGDPDNGVHAIQMEIAQRAYLDKEAEPWAYHVEKAARLRRWLSNILNAIEDATFDLIRGL